MIDENGRWYTVRKIFGKPVHFVISYDWDGWARHGKRKFVGFIASDIGLRHFVIWRLLISWEPSSRHTT